jgi:hypothetical protein
MKVREKLTDEQIKKMEKWADQKKQNAALTDKEKYAVETVEDMRKNNWKGYRLDGISEGPKTKEDLQKELDRLSKEII